MVHRADPKRLVGFLSQGDNPLGGLDPGPIGEEALHPLPAARLRYSRAWGKDHGPRRDVLAYHGPGADLGPLPWSMVTRRPIRAPGVDLHPGPAPHDVGEEPRKEPKAPVPQPVIYPMGP